MPVVGRIEGPAKQADTHPGAGQPATQSPPKCSE